MISRSDTWGAVALSAVAIPASLVAKGWASLMTSYEVPGDVAKGPAFVPNDESGSAPPKG